MDDLREHDDAADRQQAEQKRRRRKRTGASANGSAARLGESRDSEREGLVGSMLRWILPAAILVVSAGVAIRFEILGRGHDMWFAYPAGLAAQLVFGMLGLWAACGVVNIRFGRPLLALLRLAAVFAAVDAVHTFTFDMRLGGAAVMAIVHLLLISLLFPLRPAHAIFIGAVTFLIKIIGGGMIEATWYGWF